MSTSKLIDILKKSYKVKIIKGKVNLEMFLKNVLDLESDDIDEIVGDLENKIEISSEYYINPIKCVSFLREYGMKELLVDIGKAYRCDKCDKIFSTKILLAQHHNKKNDCRNKCEFCGKKLASNKNLKKHLLTKAHSKNKNINKGDNKFNNTSGKIVNSSVINNQNIINKTKNITNYNLLSFYDPVAKSISLPNKIAIFSTAGGDLLPAIIHKTHLNPETPEFHNIGYTNLHSGYGIIYDGEKWCTKKISSILRSLFMSRKEDLMEMYHELKDLVSEKDNEDIKNALDLRKLEM